jgi:Uma2 family endonuclease
MAIEYRTEPDYIEYLDGEAHPKASPRAAHSEVAGRFAHLLYRLGADEHGKILVEGDAVVRRLAGRRTKLIPDLSLMTWEQLNALEGREREYPPVAPAVAIEIWSPGDSETYLARKIERYLTEGSQLVLDVRIETRSITVHAASCVRTFAEGETLACDAVAWFTFPVRDVFSGLDRTGRR